jgi:hypothetical protein
MDVSRKAAVVAIGARVMAQSSSPQEPRAQIPSKAPIALRALKSVINASRRRQTVHSRTEPAGIILLRFRATMIM